MDITTMASEVAKPVYADILCCMCGINIQPNAANMCINCLRSREDITAGISKEVILHQCRGCQRYNRNASWVVAAPESPQLLAVCMKKVSGLQRVRLVNAEFLWTEPHSKRLKVTITVQKEVLNNAKLQQEFVVEFIIRNQQCEDCQRSYTAHTWKAIVQLRQKVDHKRTFLYLEQLIIKHNAQEKAINIEQRHTGMDFSFGERSSAAKFTDFLGSVVPIRHKTAKQLVSQDFKSNVARFKYTFSVEICPICKDDIVVLPKALAANLGCITPLVLVYQVTNYMRLVSPTTLQTAELTATKYWKHGETRSLMSAERMIEFTVLDCTPVTVTTHSSAASRGPRRSGGRRKRKARGRKRQAAGDDDGDGEDFDDASSIMASTARESGTGFGAAFGGNVGNGLGGMDRFKKRLSGGMSVTSTVAGGPKGKFLLAEVDVARTRDMGVNETTFTVLTHLGNLLKAGDSVLGYDLTGRTFNELDLNGADPEALPEIVLVRKCYPRRRAKKLPRPWQLKRLNAALAEGETERKDDVEKLARDMEMFMRDVEEDRSLRRTIPMYKDPANIAALAKRKDEDLSDVEEDFPEVPLSRLLDDMQLADAEADPDAADQEDAAGAGAGAGAGVGAGAGAGAAAPSGTIDSLDDL